MIIGVDDILPTPWYEQAGPFTLMHAAAVMVFVPMIAASSYLGVKWRGTRRERTLRLSWAWTMLFFISGLNLYWILGDFDPAFKWPLQVCDLVGFASCFALILPFRWPRTITVFLGLALCTQAFITPIVKQGPVYVHFWYFWLSHTAIVGGASYIIAVDRYRPTRCDLALALLSLYAYVGLVLPLDLLHGWNYGFVGESKPGTPTVIDRLGDWPLRIYSLGLLSTCGIVLVFLAFRAAEMLPGRRPAA